jgi:hypothetical protein
MRDIRRYWKEVRALEESLPEFVWLVDVEGSVPVEVGARQAAQLLLAKSHRVASADERRAQRDIELVTRRNLRRDERRKQGIAVVVLS